MLKISNLQACYGTYQVLYDLCFSVDEGQNLIIIGPNGCGKTTLMRCIAGLLPFTGEITLDGVSLHKLPRKQLARKIALLSQMSQVYFQYNVYETVLMGRYAHKTGPLGRTSAQDHQVVEDVLRQVDMLTLRDRDIGTLSGGQLQRVLLAKTLAQQPEIILLDEPTNHLDIRYQAELMVHLKVWSAQGNHSIIGVLHDISMAINFTDNILLLSEGHIVTAPGQSLEADTLQAVYGMDVAAHMRASLEKWKTI